MNCAVDDLLYRPSVGEGHGKEKLTPNSSGYSVASLLCGLCPGGASATARCFIRPASTFLHDLRLRLICGTK